MKKMLLSLFLLSSAGIYINAIELEAQKFDQLVNYIHVLEGMLQQKTASTEMAEDNFPLISVAYGADKIRPLKKNYDTGIKGREIEAFQAPNYLYGELKEIIDEQRSKLRSDDNYSFFIDRFIYQDFRPDVISFLNGDFVVNVTKQGGSKDYPEGIYLFILE